MDREFREIDPQVWKPVNSGDSTEGTYLKTQREVGMNDSNLHCFRDDNGKEFTVWGSKILDDKLEYVKPGDFVKITYKGTETNKKGQPVKIIKVEVEVAKTKDTPKEIVEESVKDS